MGMERKPDKFLGFECIFTGKLFNILVQRKYNAGKIETAQFNVLYMNHIMSSK